MTRLKALLALLLTALVSAAQPQPPAGPTLTLENPDLKVTWQLRDAAIVQVEWRQDGTRLLPEAGQGLGAALAAGFSGRPMVTAGPEGQLLTFAGANGERLVYRLPASGHVLELASTSVPLALLPVPADAAQARGLGRVFSLDARGIHAVAWIDTLKEPWFGLLGARRSPLPPASARLGMDAGAAGPAGREKAYFAAIWELSAVPRPGPGGYLLAAGGSGRLYLGPKHGPALAAFGGAYPQVLDFGFFGPMGQLLFRGLHLLQRAVPNWGWTLVLFSALLRLLLWPLNSKPILQGLRGRELEPQLKVIQAKFAQAGDSMAARAEQQKEVMAFYKRNGHSPMGGCLGSLAQMPIFLALYGMLGNVFELRHAPWLFWIRDLSVQDPFYVLPGLLCLGMLAQQALAPPAGDPAQRRLMLVLMPAMMLFMFASLPAGLNLYYLAFNLVGMAQTWWLTRNYRPRPVLV